MSASPIPSDFSFFWHDYETFGTRPRRDWPAQFAGVRTDAELNEIGPPLEIFCQPPLDRLPEPEACLLTGILPQQCQAQGLIETEFAAQIEAALSQPGTVGVGYNSIRFDDEVTRHLLWRNLRDPYAREWQNGCGRWDLLDVLRLAHALRPEGFEWPQVEGNTSFRLEHLTAANGLSHSHAHDALSDVRATIAVARAIKTAQPRLFDFALSLRQKTAVQKELGGVGRGARPVLHVSGMFGAERGCLALVWPLAQHPSNKNEVIVWDLAHDPEELFSLNAEQIQTRLYTRQSDLPDGVTRLPIKTIHLNKSPMVVSSLKTLSAPQAERWGLDIAQGLRHADVLAERGHLLDGLWPDVFTRPAPAGTPDVDEDLYGGFIAPDDRRTLNRVLSTPPEAIDTSRIHFSDARLDELLFRWRARNHPHTLSESDQTRWAQHRAARLLQGEHSALTLAQFFDRIDQLGETVGDDERQQDLLGALYDWAEAIAPEN